MSTSSYISLTSISAISGGAAYLTFLPRNNISSWNIVGRKIAVGVMVAGAIGWIIYWSLNKKPLIKMKKILPKLTTIRKRRTSKTSSSATASSKPSTSTSSSSSRTTKTKNDFISSPTNVSITGASTKSKSPARASTRQRSATKVERNDAISKIVENKIDEKLLPKLAEKSELLSSAPSNFLPTQEIVVPKTEAPAKIAENESVQLPSNKNVEQPSKIATAQETSVIKAIEATPKIEPSKTLDKKIEEPSLIASAPVPETTTAKVESVEPSKDLKKIESSKVPEKQQIELPSTASPFLIDSTQKTVVPKNEAPPKVAEKESIPSKALDKKAEELSLIAPVQEPFFNCSSSIVSNVETPEAKTVENVLSESMNKKAEEPSLIVSTQKATENQTRIREIESDMVTLPDVLDETQLAKDNYEKENRFLKEKLAEAKKKADEGVIQQLEEMRKKATRDLENAQQELGTTHEALNRSERNRKKLAQEVDDLNLELNNTRTTCEKLDKKQKRFDQQLAEERNRLAEVTRERDQYVQETRDRETRILLLQDELELLKDQLEDSERQRRVLQGDLDEVLSNKDEAGKSVHELERLIRQMEQERNELHVQIEDLEDGLSIAEQSRSGLEVSYQTMKAEHDRALAAKDQEVEEKRRQLIKQCRDLEAELEDEKRLRGVADKNKKKAEVQLIEVERQLEISNRLKDDYNNQFKKIQQMLKDEQQQVEETRTARDETLAQLLETEKKLRNSDAEVQRLRELTEELLQQKRKLESQHDELESLKTRPSSLSPLHPAAPPSLIASTQEIAVPKVENIEAPPKTAEKKIERLPELPAVCYCGVEGMDDAEKYSDDTTMPNLIQQMNFSKTIIHPMSFENYSPINLTLLIEKQTRKPDEWLPRPPERGKLIGHSMSINRVIFHPIYTLIVSGSDDASIRIWDVLTGRCERALTGHTNAVNDLAFNAKGNQLLSCSSDMTAKLWDFGRTYSCLRSFAGHDDSITTVAFTADNMFLTGSRDSLIKLWEPETARCIHSFRGHEDWVRMIRLNSNSRYLASCSSDKTVKVWSMENKALVVDLLGHDHVVVCVAWASDAVGKAMRIPESKEADVITEGLPIVLASAGRDKSIRVWHVNIGACLFIIDGHNDWVRGLVFHPLGGFLISVADDKTMRTWDIINQKQIKSIHPHNQFVSSVDFHKTEPYVVTSSDDSTLKLWECR